MNPLYKIPLACVFIAANSALAQSPSGGDENLRSIFTPPPGELVTLDPIEVREYRGREVGNLRGSIQVRPQSGACIIIQRHLDIPDMHICKPKDVDFRLDHLGRDGAIRWLIKSESNPYGTKVSWPTPYRIGSAARFDHPTNAAPHEIVIAKCEAKITANFGRRIHLTLLGGEIWVIQFPEKDVLIPQPPPLPNLQIRGTAKISVKDAAEQRRAREKIEKEGRRDIPESKISRAQDRLYWHLPQTMSYGMPASNFMPAGAIAAGGNGVCRYRYIGSKAAPSTGRVECHNADIYKFVLIPISCMADIKAAGETPP